MNPQLRKIEKKEIEKIEKIEHRFLKNKPLLFSLLLAFLGFLDSTYLTILHYMNVFPPCSKEFGCEKVLSSPFSVLGPFPLALFGVIFYLAVIFLCLMIVVEKKEKLINLFYLTAIVGFLVSVILFLIQALIIGSFCEFCLFSEGVSTGILILAFLEYRKRASLTK